MPEHDIGVVEGDRGDLESIGQIEPDRLEGMVARNVTVAIPDSWLSL